MTTATEPTESVLTAADSGRIRRAFANMPYAADGRVMHGNLHFGSYRDPLTVDEVVDALCALSVVLREHAEEHRAVVAAHRDLSEDVDAFRRVLGTAPEEDL